LSDLFFRYGGDVFFDNVITQPLNNFIVSSAATLPVTVAFLVAKLTIDLLTPSALPIADPILFAHEAQDIPVISTVIFLVLT